jgi:hypothetical protein
MDDPRLIEIARHVFEELRELPVDVSVNGKFVRLTKPGGILVAECRNDDCFLIGYEEPPMSGGFQVRITQPRVNLTRFETIARAKEWSGAGNSPRPA